MGARQNGWALPSAAAGTADRPQPRLHSRPAAALPPSVTSACAPALHTHVRQTVMTHLSTGRTSAWRGPTARRITHPTARRPSLLAPNPTLHTSLAHHTPPPRRPYVPQAHVPQGPQADGVRLSPPEHFPRATRTFLSNHNIPENPIESQHPPLPTKPLTIHEFCRVAEAILSEMIM